jgi:uncharacterized repeat protein (TIGR01451 family)
MKKLMFVLGGIVLFFGGVVVAGFLFFFLAGVSQDAVYLGAGSATQEMAMDASSDSIEREEAADQEMQEREMAASEAASSAGKIAVAAPVASASFADGAKVIRNGSLTLVVANMTSAVEGVEQIVAGIPGAFVASAEVRQANDLLPTTLTLRVPAHAFDQAMAGLRALAHEVLSEQTVARDVTEEYTDVDARLRNLQAAETQLLTLLEQADSVDDLLKVERRLAEVRQEIERLQGRLNVLDDRIALATILVQLHGPPDLSVEIATENLPSAHAVAAFVLTYRNTGSVAARDARLLLHVPDRLSVHDVTHGGRFEPTTRQIRWTLADVAPGAAGRVSVHLRVESTENEIQLGAHIRSAGADADLGNNASDLTLSFTPDLALEVEGPASGAQGNEIAVWISYSNIGTADAGDVTVKATLPHGLTFVRADFGGSYDRDSGQVVWKLGRLQANAGGHVWMYLRVDVDEGRLQIPATVSAEQADPVTFNNSADLFLTALREDVSERSIWQPDRTIRASLDALVVAARTAVDVFIWVLTFGIPLILIGLVALGVRAGIRHARRGRGT